MAILAAWGPHHHNQPIAEQPVGLISVLAVVLALIRQRQRQTGEHLRGVFEVEAPLCQGLGTLGRIIGDLHGLVYPQK